MRLIDADALRKEYCEDCSADIQASCNKDFACATLMWVDEAPTIDAVPVVRCKGCKYHNAPPCPMRLSLNWTNGGDFCSYGERRSENV